MFLLILSIVYAERVILITRHGHRSPKTFTKVDEKYIWTIPAETLTHTGYNQFLNVGSKYKFLPIYDAQGNCIYEKIGFQGGTTQRVLMSNVAFFTNLCPKNYVTILHRLFKEYYTQFSTKQSSLDEILKSDFKDPFQLNFKHFSRDNDFLFHGHNTDTCPNLKPIKKAQRSTFYYQVTQNKLLNGPAFDEVFKQYQAAYPSKQLDPKAITIDDLNEFYDDYLSNSGESYSFPDPSPIGVKLLEDAYRLEKFYVDNTQPLSHYSSLSEPFKWFIQQLNSKEPLSFYSGHGSNQEAMFSVLIDEQLLAPYATRLEIVVTDVVNFKLNDQILKTKVCAKGENCTIQETINFLSKYVVSDLYQQCGLKTE